jgi:hypothetical protein
MGENWDRKAPWIVFRTVLAWIGAVGIVVLAGIGGRECRECGSTSVWTVWKSTEKLSPDKRVRYGSMAVMQAVAEYRCVKVVLEAYEPHSEIAQVNVCGTRRWYNCGGFSCREIFYKAWDHGLHLSAPDDVFIATGCRLDSLGNVCWAPFRCWKCKTVKVPKRSKR